MEKKNRETLLFLDNGVLTLWTHDKKNNTWAKWLAKTPTFYAKLAQKHSNRDESGPCFWGGQDDPFEQGLKYLGTLDQKDYTP